MNILLTGGTGFLGKALSAKLRERNDVVIHTTRQRSPNQPGIFHAYVNLSDKECVQSLFDEYDFDYVFHLAANPLTDISKTSVNNIVQDNLVSTVNLLDACNKDKKVRFIYASSTTVYADKALQSAYGAYEKSATCPASVYGATKLSSEAFIQAFANMGRISPVILRYCAIVGPTATHGVVKDLTRKYLEDDVVKVIGAPPGTVKPFIYLDDAVNGTIRVAFSGKEGIYNIANSDTASVGVILDILKSQLGEKPIVWSGKTWVGDNPIVRVDNFNMRGDFGWYPKYSSYDAIETTIKELLKEKA